LGIELFVCYAVDSLFVIKVLIVIKLFMLTILPASSDTKQPDYSVENLFFKVCHVI